jgi:ribosomal protein S15P/S13E
MKNQPKAIRKELVLLVERRNKIAEYFKKNEIEQIYMKID